MCANVRTAFMQYSNPLYTSVTLPRMEGIAHYFLRNYTKIGSAMKTLADTAVEMIKARQQESGNTVVRTYVHCYTTICSILYVQ